MIPVYNAENLLNIDNDNDKIQLLSKIKLKWIFYWQKLEGNFFFKQPKEEHKWKRVSSWNDFTNMEQNIIHYSTEELTNKQT